MNEPIEDRRAAVSHLTWKSPAVWLAWIIVLGFFVTLFYQMWRTKESPDIMIGALIAALSSVIGYFFGASAAGAGKDATILGLTKTAQAVQVAADAAAKPSAMKVEEVVIDAQSATVNTTSTKGPTP